MDRRSRAGKAGLLVIIPLLMLFFFSLPASAVPVIKVTYPNGGETWEVGSTQVIRWTHSGWPGAWVKIELIRGYGVNRVISSKTYIGEKGEGSFKWTVPSWQMLGNNFKIRVTSLNNSRYTDMSDNYFTIAKAAPASLRVISPNGGETWQTGTTQNIRWVYSGKIDATVRIELLKGGVASSLIASKLPVGSAGEGFFPWSIPSSIIAGKDYRIRITAESSAFPIGDTSDGDFTMGAQSSTCQAQVPTDRWKGEYFNNLTLSGTPVMIRDDGAGFLAFDWQEGSPGVSCGVPSDNFSVRWTRLVNFAAGNYRFRVTADDGVRLWVGNQLILDRWRDQPPTTFIVEPISLAAGNHTLKMEYYERGGGATARLSWENIPITYTEWPNELSKANSDPWLAENHNKIRVMRPRVLALNFVNHRSMEQMKEHLQKAIQAIAEGSRYHGYKNPNAPAFLQYELAYAIDLRDKTVPPGYPYRNSTKYPRENPKEGYWGFDYEKLFTPEFAVYYGIPDPDQPTRFLTLCELIERGLVHEVWIYGDADVPDVSAAEVLELKPRYDANRRRIEGQMERCAGNGCFDEEDYIPCNRMVRIAWFNNTRGVGCFLESLSHGMESTGRNRNLIPYLAKYFIPFAGFDLNTRYGLPFDCWYACWNEPERPGDPPPPCLAYPTESSVRYDLRNLGRTGVIDPYDPICGNVHFAPNGRSHYDLWSPYPVRTSCGHFRDGSGKTEVFTTAAFAPYLNLAPDCMGPFLVWWRQNMPGLDNNAKDDQGIPMLNWWPFLFY